MFSVNRKVTNRPFSIFDVGKALSKEEVTKVWEISRSYSRYRVFKGAILKYFQRLWLCASQHSKIMSVTFRVGRAWASIEEITFLDHNLDYIEILV